MPTSRNKGGLLLTEIVDQTDKLTVLNTRLEAEGAQTIESPPADKSCLEALQTSNLKLKDALLAAGKALKKLQTARLASQADALVGGLIEAADPHIIAQVEGGGAALQEFLNGLKKRQFEGIAILVTEDAGKAHLGISVSESLTADFQAGALVQQLAPHIGGKGGGKPAMARGAGNDSTGIDALLEAARNLLN